MKVHRRRPLLDMENTRQCHGLFVLLLEKRSEAAQQN
jgi:hypothetical protein